MNRQPPTDHQTKSQRQGHQCDAPANHQMREDIKQQGEPNPRQAKCLDQPEDQFSAVVHNDKIVKIKEIKPGETKCCGEPGLQIALPDRQFIQSVRNPKPQIDSSHYRAENNGGFSEKQQNCTSV